MAVACSLGVPKCGATQRILFLLVAEDSTRRSCAAIRVRPSAARQVSSLARPSMSSNNAFALQRISKLLNGNRRSCAGNPKGVPAGAPVACRVKKQAVCVSWSFAAAKVRFPTDGSLDRSQSSRRVFPKCERIPVRRYEPMKRRVTLACRLHYQRYGKQTAVGVSSRGGEDSLPDPSRHIGATHRGDESRHRH